MTQVSELLERRSEGWESDPEDSGEGLYYTEKQQRVLKAILQNWDSDLSEIADKASVHPSYVRYIVNRLPKKRANDREWLMEKAGLTEDDLEQKPPALSKEEAEARKQSTEGSEKAEADSMMQTFGVGPDEVEETHEETEDGYKVSMKKLLPVTITVEIPYDTMTGESMAIEGHPMKASPDLDSDD